MLSGRVPAAAGRRVFFPVLLTVAGLAILLSSCSESHVLRPRSLLVVGDSVAAQSAEALIHLAPEATTVSVDAVRPGTAPCDWNHGFTDPTDGKFQSFAKILDEVHPEVVAFVFTGNPGLSGPAAGCVDADKPYDLAQLLASYEPVLVEMADKATSAGATVYFEAPPPRNPAVPVGYDPQKQENRGFNGSPGIASFYQSLATKDSRHWRYDDTAAVAVSSASLSWMLTLPCDAWDAKRCMDGQVHIRTGGTDAVHLDEQGCGAIRFALGLEEGALGTAPPDPKSVAAAVSEYGGCQ
jgi:hypothetical protein